MKNKEKHFNGKRVFHFFANAYTHAKIISQKIIYLCCFEPF